MDIGDKIEMLRMEREQMEAGIRYNQSIPPNERVMFNADLLRHITTMIPTPLKEAVAFAKKHQDTRYIYYKPSLKEVQSISFIQAIPYLITALEEDKQALIYDKFRVVRTEGMGEDYDDEVESSEDLYKFLDKLKIGGAFESERVYATVPIAAAKIVFGKGYVDDQVEKRRREVGASAGLECLVPLIAPREGLDEGRKQEAIRRLQEAHKLLTPKAKGKGK